MGVTGAVRRGCRRVASVLVVPEGAERLSQPPGHFRHGAAGDVGDGDEPRVDADLLPTGAAAEPESEQTRVRLAP
jgi:hypothetical protein